MLSNSTMTVAMSLGTQSWGMLAAYNLSIEEVLLSSGLGSNSRWFDPLTELCLVLAFCLAILLGLLGNGLVAFMLCRRRHLRSARHWYLLNLIVSDILTCVLCVPVTLVRLTLKDWQLGELLCRVAPFLQLTYVFVSIFTILAIAVERYRSIVCSTHLKAERHRLAQVVIPAIWLLAVGLATPLAVTHRLEHVHNVTGEGVLLTLCLEDWNSETWLGVYTVLVLLFQYVLPAVAIMALHLLICKFLRTRVHLRADSVRSRQKMARHRKNLVLLTVISITFDLEWLPITVINIVADIDPTLFPSAQHFSLMYSLCLLFALTSVFVNPVVYGWYNSNFRREMCGTRRRGTSIDRSGSTARGSSGALSRFYSLIVRSSAISRLQDSMDKCGATSPPRPHHARLVRHHSSMDASHHVWAFTRQARMRAQRMSLQFELK